MDIGTQQVAPFVYFMRRLRAGPAGRVQRDTPALQQVYGLWRQRVGTTTVHGSTTSIDVRPGQIGLFEPGCRLELHAGSQGLHAAFELLPRRRIDRGETITLDIDEPVQPPWRELFGQSLPILVPTTATVDLLPRLDRWAGEYWRSAMVRMRVSLELGAWLFRHVEELQNEPDRSGDDDGLIRRFNELVRLRFRDPVTVAELARALAISPAQLHRRHVAYLHEPPGEALARERLEQARKALEHEGMPVAELAGMVGYRDVSAFIRAFRRRFGLTPARWRDRHRRSGL